VSPTVTGPFVKPFQVLGNTTIPLDGAVTVTISRIRPAWVSWRRDRSASRRRSSMLAAPSRREDSSADRERATAISDSRTSSRALSRSTRGIVSESVTRIFARSSPRVAAVTSFSRSNSFTACCAWSCAILVSATSRSVWACSSPSWSSVSSNRTNTSPSLTRAPSSMIQVTLTCPFV
jgi:hypothetical protein